MVALGSSRCHDGVVRRAKAPLLILTVALVLADSAVVTLALPDVLREYDTEVAQVAWVLTAFNLVLAIAAALQAYIPRSVSSVRSSSSAAGHE